MYFTSDYQRQYVYTVDRTSHTKQCSQHTVRTACRPELSHRNLKVIEMEKKWKESIQVSIIIPMPCVRSSHILLYLYVYLTKVLISVHFKRRRENIGRPYCTKTGTNHAILVNICLRYVHTDTEAYLFAILKQYSSQRQREDGG